MRCRTANQRNNFIKVARRAVTRHVIFQNGAIMPFGTVQRRVGTTLVEPRLPLDTRLYQCEGAAL